MSTYGELRSRLSQQFPGIRLGMWDGWIADRYVQILDRLDWSRAEKQTALETAAEQSIYALPADCRILQSICSPDTGRPLDRISRAKLDEIDAGRTMSGSPQAFAPAMDDASDPPRMQVELWPIPTAVIELSLSYTAEAPALSGTSVSLLPWVRPAALFASSAQDACMFLAQETPGFLALADRWGERFESAVSDMTRTECANRPAEQMRMANRFTRHRARRWQR
jgi:hypothetical protein